MESLIDSPGEKDDAELIGSRVGRLNIASPSGTDADAADPDTTDVDPFDKPTDDAPAGMLGSV